jgi:hypothetical protein
VLEQQFVDPAPLVDGSRDEHQRGLGLSPQEERLEIRDGARRGVAFPLGRQEHLRLRDHDDAARGHHRHGAGRRDEAGHAVNQLVPGCHVAGVDAFDVEGAQPFLDDLGELARQRRLLDVVFSQEKIDRIGAGRRDLLSNSARRRYRHGSVT